MKKAITSFTGEYQFLSNFFLHQIVDRDGIEYDTAEHAYQAQKCVLTKDLRKILRANTPGKAKKLGRKVRCYKNWDEVKLKVMEQVLRQKFANKNLKRALLKTRPHKLIEGNTWGDTFWGQCNGKGENHLGKLLMKIRKEL